MNLPTVSGTLFFVKDLDLHKHEKPFMYAAGKTNLETEPHRVDVSDIRGNESLFQFETNGFEIISHETRIPIDDFANESILGNEYLKEMESLLRARFKAHKVVFFGWRCRENSQDSEHRPITLAHIDQTQAAVIQRVKHHLGENEAAEVLRKRKVMIVNTWRTLVEPLEDTPLAFGDRTTVRTEDCVATDIILAPDMEDGQHTGEAAFLRFSEDQRYYYLSQQRIDEVTLLFMGGFDPKDPSDKLMGTPHCAFSPSRENTNASPRKSVEVRAIVIE